MAMGAVGVDEPEHLRLLIAVEDVDATTAGGKRTGQGGPERSAVVAQRKALEKCAPRRVHGVGIVEPCGVGRLDDGGVGVGREGK